MKKNEEFKKSKVFADYSFYIIWLYEEYTCKNNQ